MVAKAPKKQGQPRPKETHAQRAARRKFVACAEHALPNRRCAGEVARVLAQFNRVAVSQCIQPYFTHVKIASMRGGGMDGGVGRLHRNTSREIVRELDEVGLITVQNYDWRTGRDGSRYINCKFRINWTAIDAYWQDNCVAAAAARRGEKRMDCNEWIRKMTTHGKEADEQRTEAMAAKTAQRLDEAREARENAVTAEERHAIAEDLRRAMNTSKAATALRELEQSPAASQLAALRALRDGQKS